MTTPPTLTAEGTLLGTIQYMAPEQLEGREADARSDLFAFGAVLYEMLTGRPAFAGSSQSSVIAAVLDSEPPPIVAIQPLTPPVLAHIEAQYQRHGTYGIFVSRLLPVWRAVVPPFAGIAGVSAPRALIPLALASALWYGLLTLFVATLGTNLGAVVAALAHVNRVLGAVALGIVILLAVWIVRRLKR